MKVAPKARFIHKLILCSFITVSLFKRISKNNVINGITNGLKACEAIKIHTGLPPRTGTIRPDNATKTTISSMRSIVFEL